MSFGLLLLQLFIMLGGIFMIFGGVFYGLQLLLLSFTIYNINKNYMSTI